MDDKFSQFKALSVFKPVWYTTNHSKNISLIEFRWLFFGNFCESFIYWIIFTAHRPAISSNIFCLWSIERRFRSRLGKFLFNYMGSPARNSSNGKNRGEQIHRNSQTVIE